PPAARGTAGGDGPRPRPGRRVPGIRLRREDHRRARGRLPRQLGCVIAGQMLIAGRRIEGIGLGTAQFAFRDGTVEDCLATLHAALDAGVRLIDTALAYTRAGVESYAEQVVARALRGVSGERPLIATKGGHWRDGDRFPVNGRPDTRRGHCEISLRTLETDRIAL